MDIKNFSSKERQETKKNVKKEKSTNCRLEESGKSWRDKSSLFHIQSMLPGEISHLSRIQSVLPISNNLLI